jgi:hypothetical protein
MVDRHERGEHDYALTLEKGLNAKLYIRCTELSLRYNRLRVTL